ncbi:MAG: hypothetical protein ACD_43C00021G0002 [uncultured bacterium]|nr:MAG: hypothetical protein ACD_43C00021G0002 [uncultured bacterium]
MNFLAAVLDFFLHIDTHIGAVIAQYGTWTYAIMFLVIFCETGLVVTPVLPGDSLLFTLGAFAAQGALNWWVLVVILFFAVVLGDNTNYWIGYHIGPKIFSGKKIPWLNIKHLEETQRFYERHGGKTIILARFIPIIRTFAPFVAGIGRMPYSRFLLFSLSGGLGWITIGIGAGYLFGNIPAVQDNFTLVLVGIVVISLLPAMIKYWQHRRRSTQQRLV